MAIFNKFEQFTIDHASGLHDNAINTDIDVLSIYLTNVAPNAATHSVKADIAEIAIANGYTGPEDTLNAATNTSGTVAVVGTDIIFTATADSIGPFQYVVLFNDSTGSPSIDALIGWWSAASPITLANGEKFTVNFGVDMFTVA